MPSSIKSSASIQIMLSRSSSAYQPLEGGVADGGGSGGGGGINNNTNGGRGGGSSAVGPSSYHDEENAHEMTSIAVISSHPLRSGSGQQHVNTQILSSANKPPDDFSTLCVSEEKSSWTNFHFVMCIGIIGFFVFWIVLLCRMYLPTEYWFWSGSSTDSVSAPPPPPVVSGEAQRLPSKVDILDSLPNLGE